jgi:hypothetical protein
MGKKPGHHKSIKFKMALGDRYQVFEGYPHRRHNKSFNKSNGIKKDIINQIREKESEQYIRKIKYNLSDENL